MSCRRHGRSARTAAGLLAALCFASPAHGVLRRRGAGSGAGAGAGGVAGADSHHVLSTGQSGTAAGLTVAVEDAAILSVLADSEEARRPAGKGGLDELVREKVNSLDLDTAVKQANVPQEVVAMLKGEVSTHRKANASSVAEAAETPEEAVAMMNRMISRAQERLDSKVVECQQFKRKTAKTAMQVKKDLARLGQQLANNARIMTTAMGSIDEATKKAQALKEEETQQEIAYKQLKKVDGLQFEMRKQDLQDAEFILDLTRCPGVGFLQRGSGSGSGSGAGFRATSTSFDACFSEDKAGASKKSNDDEDDDDVEPAPQEVRFVDSRIEAAAAKMSPKAQMLLKSALGRMELDDEQDEAETPPMLPGSSRRFPTGPKRRTLYALALESRRGNRTLQAPGTLPVVPPAKLPADEAKQAQKCIALEPGCGILHDAFASLWGDLKDLVDESRAKLYQDDIDWEQRRLSINSQLESVAAQKGVLQTDLAEAMSAKSSFADQQTMKFKEDQDLSKIIDNTMADCSESIREIVFTEMASAMRVRNEIVRDKIAGSDVSDITDCQVSNWVPGECPVQCDDTLVGGLQVLRREIVVKGNGLGAPCPNLTYTSQCNQVKCPVDCVLADWSSFSKCTKECDGGVQSRTRLQIEKPRYGGQSCDALTESRACNTGSCDRDCVLGDWSEWSTCSKACGGGFIEREKEVITPIRANGLCPAKDSPKRMETQSCNEQLCVGDEICLAAMDLVLVIDSSGSINDEGFTIMKTYAAKLVERFQKEAYGKQAARVGIVQFGNGKLGDDKVVSDAILVNPLTDDFAALATTIQGMQWKQGFTNLAQGLLKAKDVLFNGRMKAEHVVMVLTDGRPTFKNQAVEAVQKLRASSRLVMVHIQAFRKKSGEALLKSFASDPWQTNYLHIPGKEALRADYDKWVAQSLVEVCPRSMSPSRMASADQVRGFTLAREGVTCGPSDAQTVAPSMEDCRTFADTEFSAEWKAFAFSKQSCQVYKTPCQDYEQNSTYNVYERLQQSTDF